MATKGVHDKFFYLLTRLPGATKESLVWQYSNMLTTSLREFLQAKPEDYKRMIAEMEIKVASSRKVYTDPEKKKLRSNIMLRLQKHGIDTTHWRNVNTFLLQPRIAGKMLFEMSVDEMKALIPKLEAILKKDSAARASEIKMSERN